MLLISHGNTLHSLVMHLDNIALDAIEKVEIAPGVPWVYRFNEVMEVVGWEWLV